MKRETVQVDSDWLESGEIVPIRITWQDGRVWNIDRVIHSCASLDVISVVRKDTYTELVTHGT